MKKPRITAALFGLVCAVALAGEADAYTFTTFGPGVFAGGDANNQNSMNAAIGITGMLIEDFDDTNYLPGLTFNTGNQPPNTLLTNLWGADDTNSLFVGGDPPPLGVFYSPGTADLGIGFGQMRATPTISINGGAPVTFSPPAPWSPSDSHVRNGYLLIQSEAGDAPITSMVITSFIDFGGTDGGIAFDHIAVSPIPEPSSFVLWIGLIALTVHRSRRRRVRGPAPPERS